ncbi:response regulator [Paenibacillus urinalis]|uniref:response regulator n=1 Tax=Paenibacillus urinalis TaxID=521520 RepID=UPI0019616E09
MIRALIVDDEPMQIQGLVRHVDWEKVGYSSPLTARSGEEALEILEHKKVDVLITDVCMSGGITGIELLAKLSDYPHLQSLQTVIISGYEEFEFVQEAIHLGAKGYLLKPIKTEELEQKLTIFRSAIERKDQIEKEATILKEKLSVSFDVLQDRFVNDLLEGGGANEEFIDSWRQLIDLPSGEWQLRLFLFTCDDLYDLSYSDARQRILLRDGLLKTVKVGFSDFTGIYVGKTGSGEAALLHLNSTPEERAKVEKQLSFVQDVIREHFGASVSIGVSRECEDLKMTPVLYKEVRHMISKERVSGSGHIHYFNHSQAFEYREFRMQEEYIREIVRTLENGEDERAIALFNHAFDILQFQTPISFSVIQAFGMGLISELVWRFISMKENDGDRNIQIWQQIISSNDVGQVKEIVLESLYRYAQFEKKERGHQQHNLINKVERYIEEHLRDHVTVKQLAERFHLNPSYLSVLFKKETGWTISEFIQEKRMSKAKLLLQDPNIKIYEVAEEVGFQATPYFTFLFKKITGVTPQGFRDYYSGNNSR